MEKWNIGWMKEGAKSRGGRYLAAALMLTFSVTLTKELGSCQCIELPESGSSHLVNADSREGITIRNHMVTELMRWLPGSRADAFLDPNLPNSFVHDQSQTEPRNT